MILHINTFDKYGGAEQIAKSLMDSSPDNYLLVKEKFTSFKNVDKLGQTDLFSRITAKVFKKDWRTILGVRDSFHNTFRKLSQNPYYKRSTAVHLHNIHGGYFDVNCLQDICKEKKVVWTLHDMWCMTGGEAHTFGNENFKRGIGNTSFKQYYPLNNPILDFRNHYLQQKKKIYTQCGDRLIFVPASKWVEQQLKDSYVYHANMKIHTIHNGINTNVFKRTTVRTWIQPRILFFNSNSPFKGSKLFIKSLPLLKNQPEIWVIGNELEECEYINVTIKNIGKVKVPEKLNQLFNQVDIMVFPSIAETFPLTVLEAMAAGVCVVGSAVGGIPEQIDENTGFLFENRSIAGLIESLNQATSDLSVSRRLGQNAEEKVHALFTLEGMIKQYHHLYKSI